MTEKEISCVEQIYNVGLPDDGRMCLNISCHVNVLTDKDKKEALAAFAERCHGFYLELAKRLNVRFD